MISGSQGRTDKTGKEETGRRRIPTTQGRLHCWGGRERCLRRGRGDCLTDDALTDANNSLSEKL